MSLNVFATLCILGIDFLIYVLFQWTYGDKRRFMAQKIAAQRNALQQQPRPFLLAECGPSGATPIRYSRQRRA